MGGEPGGRDADARTVQALAQLAGLPDVVRAVESARDAGTRLRWHPALRRMSGPARAEATIRAVRCSAALAGARLPLPLVRDAARGTARFPDNAVGRTVQGALRAVGEVERLGDNWQQLPLQALARLHLAAGAGLVADDALGRPRPAGSQPSDGLDLLDVAGVPLVAPDGELLTARLESLASVLRAPGSIPALVVAAVAHAEVAVARPFTSGNGVVARALCRAVVIKRGLDASGVAVWEAALLDVGTAYPAALSAYATGSPAGVVGWIELFGRAVKDGAAEGMAVCDAVLSGRLPG